MLNLKNIHKDYSAGASTVEALRGIDLAFRQNEFVAILGPSGCGKTTLLNLLGGLDRYTSGDLIINGKSTKDFTDRDWDTYRNQSIGFVFQNYNLIPHQSVLRNVELAMTLSGVGKAQRRRRATEVLGQVGLHDQIHKRPSQLSGGQMQRVAIARALVNNPDILLADEPTGALDTETSVQVMDILKEIAGERLVIMVTHNRELADQYATRTISLLDGKVTGDTNPYSQQDAHAAGSTQQKKAKTSMSFFTALSLSLNNLMTKKARTFLTAFAGSIGIIGIALILALSTGFQGYIDRIQEDTLSTYPIVIESTTQNMGAMLESMAGTREEVRSEERAEDVVYGIDMMGTMTSSMLSGMEKNDLKAFKAHIEETNALESHANAISYGYDINLNLFRADTQNGIVQVNPSTVMDNMMPQEGRGFASQMPMGRMMNNAFEELLPNQALLESQYDVVAGRWPEKMDEMVLVISENNALTDMALYSLGLKDPKELNRMMTALSKNETYETESMEFTYDELLDLRYKLVPSTEFYQMTASGYRDMRDSEPYMKKVLRDAMELSIVGILRPSPEAQITSIQGSVGYTHALTEYMIEITADSPLVKAQMDDPDMDIFTGKPFGEPTMPDMSAMDMSMLSPEMQMFMQGMTEEELMAMAAEYMPQMQGSMMPTTYEDNLRTLGMVSLDTPSRISIYPKDFDAKDAIDAFIDEYNDSAVAAGHDEQTISYTDLIGIMMSSVSTIINAISYVLIAFVAISLVVSSIMIGIITYVSVLERTKEIGILKSIGASRKDISRVFNAETLIVGLVSGLIGILTTMLLTIPINMIIESVIYVAGIAKLPAQSATVLVLLSMGLTFIAGLIPARLAARKDPVVALRSE